MKKYLSILVLMIASAAGIRAQLVINNTINATDGVQNVLLGPGVTVSNLNAVGANEQFGQFTCVNCNLGITNGLVMGSGNVDGAAGPNTSTSTQMGPTSGFNVTDADLEELSGNDMHTCAIIQFDFVPTGDSLVFRFVFGSEEYPEYVGFADFNDAFGFFLSGPGINGPYTNNAKNIALVPNTNLPISIANINNGTSGTNGPCTNCQYYIHNPPSNNSPVTAIESDGFTTVLTAYSQVICGETYHIKLAIGDSFDEQYDSYVFLEAGSFQSNQLAAAVVPATIGPSANGIYEGCVPATITFTRPSLTSPSTYSLDIMGSAVNGVDYTSIPSTITFAPGSLTYDLEIEAIQDNLGESTETVIISVADVTPCNQAATTYTIEILDIPVLQVQDPSITINCDAEAVLTPQITGGVGYYTVTWADNSEGPSYNQLPASEGQVSYTVSDTCGVTPYQGIGQIQFATHPPIQVDLGSDQSITCLENVNINPIISGGYGAYTYQWNQGSASIGNGSTLSYHPSNAGTISLTVTDVCDATGNDAMTFTIPPVAVSVDLGQDQVITCIQQTTINPVVSGGVGSYTYSWADQAGVLGTSSTLVYQTDEASTVVLSVLDQCGNTQQDFVSFAVPAVAVSADLGQNLTVTCLDQTTLLPSVGGGVGTFSYQWVAAGQNVSNASTYTIQTDEDVAVQVFITDQCGNTTTDQIQLSVPAVPVIVDAGAAITATCLDVNALSASVSGGVGNYTYRWEDPNQLIGITANQNYTASADVLIHLTVEDQCGNISEDDIQISIPPVPVYLVLPVDTAICLGESVELTAQGFGGVGDLDFKWLANDWPYETLVDAPSTNKTYQVELTDACGNTTIDEVVVTVEDVKAGYLERYIDSYQVELIESSANAISFEWYLNDELVSEETSMIVDLSNNQMADVRLEATGSLGCVKTVSGEFFPLADLFIPNSFSPNGDGLNDFFKAEGHDIKSFEIWIFNRWGDMVFHSTDIDARWDGGFQSGDYFSQNGSYTYRVEAVGKRMNDIRRSGTITIIR